jgi:hypothetical protein
VHLANLREGAVRQASHDVSVPGAERRTMFGEATRPWSSRPLTITTRRVPWANACEGPSEDPFGGSPASPCGAAQAVAPQAMTAARTTSAGDAARGTGAGNAARGTSAAARLMGRLPGSPSPW